MVQSITNPLSLGWLIELLEEISRGRFPQPQSIVLEECYSARFESWKLIDVAELIPEIAEVEVRVCVRIMVPEALVDMCIAVLRGVGFTEGVDTSREDVVRAHVVESLRREGMHVEADEILAKPDLIR